MKRSLLTITFIAMFSLLLTACSGMRIVDSDVTAYSAWSSTPPRPGTPYRFERLPSQLAIGPQQDRIEASARTSLARVGMVMEPGSARFSVQVIVNTQVVERHPDDSFAFGGPGVFFGAGNYGSSFGLSFPLRIGNPYYLREIKIVMRDLGTQKVVFETRALNDGPWGDGLAVLPAMLDAALMGFPQPPPGTRRVNVEIPR